MKLDNIIAKRPNKTIYRDGDRVIKMFGQGFSKADILNEALNHSRVEETGLPIPHIHEVTVIDGCWAIVIDYIPGRTLQQIMDEDPDGFDGHLERFVDLQLEVLSKRAPLLNRLDEKMDRKIKEADLDPTTRYDLHTRLAAMEMHGKVCHGDFNPSNIIITPEGKPYILDWSHATQGNASADAARTYLLFCLAGDREKADKYLHTYCRRADSPMQYIQQWLPIVAASQSVKAKSEERELLLSWVNVVDYE